MSCTSPRCVLIPPKGRPIFMMDDEPRGSIIHPHYGVCRITYLPCGGCLACRRERRMDLTVLQACEASLHADNWFITLTYEDESTFNETGLFPYSLDRTHLSDFCLSMRKHCSYFGDNWRYFACGEYGSLNHRPHYHLSVFGVRPSSLGLPEDVSVEDSRRDSLFRRGSFSCIGSSLLDDNGNEFWQSPVISKFWRFGNHKIYRANTKTFQYVAGYVTKKLNGDLARSRRAVGLQDEFQIQSRPSIGYPWFLRFVNSLSSIDCDKLINDSVDIAGISWRCPRIFSKWLVSMDYFDGEKCARFLSKLRQLDTPAVPDREDLLRISHYDRYRSEISKLNNTHKEVR